MLIQRRIEGFDFLKAIALFMVLLQHFFMFTEDYYPKLRIFWILSHNALDFFFVLSGFLIAGILDKIQIKGHFNLKGIIKFYIRRWFKTIPMYLLIIICLILSYLNIYYANDFSLSFLIFTQNLYKANFHFLPHTYSLTIEEWFYILFPVCVMFFLNFCKKNNSFYLSILFWISFAIIVRLIINLDLENWDIEIRKSLISRIDAPTYGILIYFLLKNNYEKIKNHKNILAFIGVIFCLFFTYLLIKKTSLLFNNVFYYTFIPLCISFSLPYFYFLNFTKKINNFFRNQSLASYSIYLIHLPLMYILKNHFIVKSSFKSILLLILSIALSYLIGLFFYKYYKKPVMDLRISILI